MEAGTAAFREKIGPSVAQAAGTGAYKTIDKLD
jgi:hypothetical protein